MKIIIATLLSVLMSGSALADWVKVKANAEFTTYARQSTTQRRGHMAKMMSMYDYKLVQTRLSDSVLYMSTQQQGEYDCKDEKSRMLSHSVYRKNMGGGKAVHFKAKPLEWAIVAPDSVAEALWKIACGKSQTHQSR